MNFLKQKLYKPVPKLDLKTRRQLVQKGYDLDLIARTQPQGGVVPHDEYFQYGDGVAAMVTVYNYPASGLADYWLLGLLSQEYIIGFVSIGTENKEEIIKNISKSLDEKASQISSKNKAAANLDARDDYLDNARILQELKRSNDQLKRLYVRLMVYAPNLKVLDERIKKIQETNSELGMTRFLGEQEDELISSFIPTLEQEHLLFKRKGMPVDLSTIGGSYWLNHTKLNDPLGSYFGFTKTNGPINFDFWQRDEQRTRSFMFVSGGPGMGKSTLMKMLTYDSFTRGHHIRNFDISNEYTGLTKKVGGMFIDLASSDSKINPMEVFATKTNDDGTINVIDSFNYHINKLKTIFDTLNNAATADDNSAFDRIITQFYIERGMWSRDPERDQDKLRIVGLPHDQYPILSDFVLFLKQQKRLAVGNNETKTYQLSLDRIFGTFDALKTKEGSIFEGYTNINDFEHEPWVTFRTGSLKTHGQDVYNAQMHSILSFLMAHVVNNGNYWRREISAHRATDEDVSKYLINIDECQEVVTSNFPEGAELIASMMEKMRKYYCGITLAAPSIKGIIMSDNDSEHDTPYMSAVKKIFGLCQFRCFFNLPPEDVNRLASALPGSISAEELQSITKLKRREVFMNISGVKNLTFQTELTNEKEMIQIFGGGEG